MILLLLYNHIVYVSSYVLNCPLMVDKNGVEVSVSITTTLLLLYVHKQIYSER